MHKLKEKNIFLQAFLWWLVYAVFSLVASNQYLFGWIIHNNNFYIALGLISVLVTFINKKVGYAMTLGNICGLLLGHFLGGYMQKMSMLRIKPNMTAQQIYQLSDHRGVFMWVCTILIAIIAAIVIELVLRVIKKLRL